MYSETGRDAIGRGEYRHPPLTRRSRGTKGSFISHRREGKRERPYMQFIGVQEERQNLKPTHTVVGNGISCTHTASPKVRFGIDCYMYMT